MAKKTLTEFIESRRGSPEDFPLTALAHLIAQASKVQVHANQETLGVAKIGRYVVTKPMRATKFLMKVTNAGDDGGDSATTVMPMVIRKGAAVDTAAAMLAAAASVADDAGDAVVLEKRDFHATDSRRDLNPGDMVYFDVTAVADGGDGLAVCLELEPRLDV